MRTECCGVMENGQCTDCPYTVPLRPSILDVVKPVGPIFEIGQYLLHHMRNGQVWIGHDSGEGMACDAATLEAALAAFWAEHF